MLEIQDLQHEMPGQMGNRFSQDIMKAYDKANKEYNQFIQEASRKHTELFTAEDWDAVLSHAQEVLKREHSVAEQKELGIECRFGKTETCREESGMELLSQR